MSWWWPASCSTSPSLVVVSKVARDAVKDGLASRRAEADAEAADDEVQEPGRVSALGRGLRPGLLKALLLDGEGVN